MFSTLLESNRPRTTAGGSLALSLATHLAIGALAVVATTGPARHATPESFITRALFLPPADRRPAIDPQAERLQYLALGAPVGLGGEFEDRVAGDTDAGRIGLPPAGRREEGSDQADAAALEGMTGNDTAFSMLDVDSTVQRYADSDAPLYPPTLLLQAVEGTVFLRYIVDTLGHADPRTAEVLRSSHPAFTQAVLAALPGMRFRPAMIASRRVRQLVEQEFAFRIAEREIATTAP